MSTNKLLSILIPTFNRVESVIALVESITSKYLDKIEIVIVDNCSPDNIYSDLEKKLPDNKDIKLYRNKTNIGMVKNFNKCIEYASGEWLSLICSDDLYTKNAIDRIVTLIKTIKKPTLIIQDPTINREYEESPSGAETVKKLRLPIASGNVWHRDITNKLGSFDERIKYSPDAELWPRIAFNYPVLKIKEHTAIYNTTASNYGFQTWIKDDFLEQTELLARINLNYYGDMKESEKENMIDQGINQTIITILYNTIFSKEKWPIFIKYFKIFMIRNRNIKHWMGLIKKISYMFKFHRKK